MYPAMFCRRFRLKSNVNSDKCYVYPTVNGKREGLGKYGRLGYSSKLCKLLNQLLMY